MAPIFGLGGKGPVQAQGRASRAAGPVEYLCRWRGYGGRRDDVSSTETVTVAEIKRGLAHGG
jgi:hypothetical protein